MLALISTLSGCGKTANNPFASFESRCASLPAAHFEVVVVPVEYVEDDASGVASLTTRSGAAMDRHRTYGLTIGRFGHQTSMELRSVEDARRGRACGTPNVRVELSMQPVDVFIASEIAGDRCLHDATFDHEMKHVAAMHALLDEAGARLRDELADAIGPAQRSAGGQAMLQAQFDARVRGYLAEFMREESAILAERQAAIDTPEEYARVGSVCKPLE